MEKNLNADLMSVNAGLYDDLFIQKLETRLETDPLGVGGLVDLIGDNTVSPNCLLDCPEFSCFIKG